MFRLALTVCAALSAQVRLVVDGDEVVGVDIGFEDDISAYATITSIRAATGHEFLSTETTTAISTVTGFGMNTNLIYKLHRDTSS